MRVLKAVSVKIVIDLDCCLDMGSSQEVFTATWRPLPMEVTSRARISSLITGTGSMVDHFLWFPSAMFTAGWHSKVPSDF